MFGMRTTPDCVYKYLEPCWAEAMLARGSVRVGSLVDFRREEHRERGDDGEGTLTGYSDELPTVGSRGANTFVTESRVPDAFIYCVTESFDLDVMRKFGGACIRVFDVNRFFSAIDAGVRSQCGTEILEAAVEKCVYTERRQSWSAIVAPPWQIKPSEYRHQREIRGVWIPASPRIAALNLFLPEIIPCCERWG